MLKILIKKQLFETFRSLFVDQKTGKKRSKGKRIGFVILFVFVFICLAFSFFGMSMILVPILSTDLAWLYYAIFGIVAICLGAFVTSFSSASSIYGAKDNDLLLSMPIKPGHILLSRMFILYILSVLYAGCVWLPVCLNGFIVEGFNLLTLIIDIVLLAIIGILICGVSCIIGYLFALISKRSKNKTLISILSSILIVFIYYFTSFKMQSAFESLILNGDKAANNIRAYAYLFYALGKAATGDFLNLLVFIVISIVVFAIVYYLLSKNFISIVTRSQAVKKVTKKVNYERKTDAKTALLKKEFKRFLSSPAYLMNTGLGVIFILGFAVVGVVKANDINTIIPELIKELPFLAGYLPLAIASTIMLVASIDCISCPSISLEGKNLWILKTLPVNYYDIFEAKERLHVLINGVPSLITAVIFGYLLKLDYSLIIYLAVLILLFVDFQALIGLVFGILRPNFNWTNETQPIKQSLNVLFVMLIGWIFVIAMAAGYYFLSNKVSIENYLYIIIIVLLIAVIFIKRWLRDKGTKLFGEL